MAIYKVQTPDGKTIRVEGPDGASDEEVLAFAQKSYKEESPGGISSIAKAGKTVWDNLARGLGNTVSAATSDSRIRELPELGPDTSPKGKFSQAVAADVAEKLPVSPNESLPERLTRKGTEAIGGGLLMGLPGLIRAPVAGLTTLFAGGVGSDLGGTAGRKLGGEGAMGDFTEGAGSLLGGAALALPTGMFTGPRLSSGETTLRRNMEGLGADDFKQAGQNLDLFKRAGAKTHTLPEAFDGRTSLLGLAETVRASKGGESLANLTQNRKQDLQGLGSEFLKRVNPNEVDSNVVAGKAVTAANATEKFLRNARTDAFSETLKGQTLKPTDAMSIYTQLMQEARAHKNPSDGAQLAKVAERFLDERKARPNGKRPLLTDLQALSLRIKELKDDPTIGDISAHSAQKAIDRAEELLSQKAPAFAKANSDFQNFTRGVIEPTMEGPMNRLTDKNPFNPGDPSVNRLNPLFSGTSPDSLADTLHQLSRQKTTGNKGVDPSEVVKAWAQQRLEGGSTNPGNTLRGLEGSSKEARLAAALSQAGKDPTETMLPLQAADRMQNFFGLPGMREQGDLSPASLLVRPRQSIGFRLTEGAREKTNAEIAKLLTPTRENLAKLQEIAKFDPSVRQMLIARGIMVPQFSDKE